MERREDLASQNWAAGLSGQVAEVMGDNLGRLPVVVKAQGVTVEQLGTGAKEALLPT